MKLFKLHTISFLYGLAYAVCKDIFESLTNGYAHGVEQIPKKGAFIIASNHISFLDPPMVGTAINRECYYFARSTLFSTRFSNWLLRGLNSIPVNLKAKSDVGAIKEVLKLFNQQEGVVFFPEGTRSRDGNLKNPKAGIGLIACKARVPIVPTRIFGAYEALKPDNALADLRHDVSIVYGKPLLPEEYDPGKNHKNRYQEASNRIMQAIASLEKPRILNY